MAQEDKIYEYYSKVLEIIRTIYECEKDKIAKAAEIFAEALSNDHIIHVAGAGHSAMAGEELFYRAGGLVPVDPMIGNDITIASGAIKSTLMESVKGYAKVILEYHNVREDDIVVVVSTSGKNQFPVEMAIEAKNRGAKTIGITSVAYSQTLEPKNSYGKKLYEVVDLVIDNHVPPGDAVIEYRGFPVKTSPVSTIANTFIVNSIVAQTTQLLLEKGIEPPVWLSAHLPGAMEYNLKQLEKYRGRIRLL
ncbi:MAG: SIS domain-containing protein [Crenarchaeota archaeon]|nr:SIS domain-containing protein [Thermoproteota archaeon]